MSTRKPIDSLSIRGFRSFRELDSFELRSLNVLIGSNGSGKSNFISFFRLLHELAEGRLKLATGLAGGADRLLYRGRKHTSAFEAELYFGLNGYRFTLEPTVADRFVFTREEAFFNGLYGPKTIRLGSGHEESPLRERWAKAAKGSEIDHVYSSLASWRVYHFHDTSDSAALKRPSAVHDHAFLRPDAANLAAFLYWLEQEHAETFDLVTRTVRLVVPAFHELRFITSSLPGGEEQVQMVCRERDHDYPLHLSQLSDGSLRFICLAAALLQPDPPATILIDEPELGLHPAAITLLGSLFKQAAQNTQVIASTQSPLLLDQLEPQDVVVVDREQGESVLRRLGARELSNWLDEFSIGELWQKISSAGDPGHEAAAHRLRGTDRGAIRQ